jgi:hypothetical protein
MAQNNDNSGAALLITIILFCGVLFIHFWIARFIVVTGLFMIVGLLIGSLLKLK